MNIILKRLYYSSIFSNILKTHYKTLQSYKTIMNINMKGGAFNIEYKTHTIKFKKLIDDGILKLYLSTPDEETNCISILIDINNKIAYIEGVTNNEYYNCFDEPELNNGKTIMEISLKMLEKYKDKLNLKKIELKDNSFLTCDKNIKIILSDLSLLQHNETFYSRYGFRPKDEENYENYMKNKAILSITIVKKIKLDKILNTWSRHVIDDKLKYDMLKHYDKYLDYNIVQWFNLFSRKFMKKDCILFKYIIDSIYIKLGLIKLNGVSYIKKLL